MDGRAHAGGPGLRGRFRAQVRDEIKQVALRQLADGGPQALSLNAVAKVLGVSGPALYRYFANRDALLTDLVVDAYRDLAAACEAATAGAWKDPADRLRALAKAYRAWALEEPHRYRLLFRAPLYGYDAHSEPLVQASQIAMNVAVEVLEGIAAEGPVAGGELEAPLAEWAAGRGMPGAAAVIAVRATTLWARLHGLVSLEIEGNFASMGLDPTPLYEGEITNLLTTPPA
ncbi:TetR/AcrR family transcriptional regulator [Planotetraspora phitsanulokensis]|uniref:TetR family transcriptional regulator n=1 Tax=Planotetraspora phitsanulokensis TaxID=575192 RepID=A0A8J3XD41_9ACTN|nr:TetR family transcriptional regulator [Planotetraspora phitsanulokensis]